MQDILIRSLILLEVDPLTPAHICIARVYQAVFSVGLRDFLSLEQNNLLLDASVPHPPYNTSVVADKVAKYNFHNMT